MRCATQTVILGMFVQVLVHCTCMCTSTCTCTSTSEY